MRTVVYQSFRVQDVPPWVSVCMDSVREWAEASGFDYRFIDDALFDYVPSWYRQKVNNQIHLVSDLARLKLAQEYLAEGYERTIWVDADVVIFAPERFRIDVTEQYAFCHEVYVHALADGRFKAVKNVNNAVTVFCQGNSSLEFFIHAAEETVRNHKKPPHTAVSTDFLSAIDKHFPLPKLYQIALFSPYVLSAIEQGKDGLVEFYMQQFNHRIDAANLCTTFRNTRALGLMMDDGVYLSVIERLRSTGGEQLNRFVPQAEIQRP